MFCRSSLVKSARAAMESRAAIERKARYVVDSLAGMPYQDAMCVLKAAIRQLESRRNGEIVRRVFL